MASSQWERGQAARRETAAAMMTSLWAAGKRTRLHNGAATSIRATTSSESFCAFTPHCGWHALSVRSWTHSHRIAFVVGAGYKSRRHGMPALDFDADRPRITLGGAHSDDAIESSSSVASWFELGACTGVSPGAVLTSAGSAASLCERLRGPIETEAERASASFRAGMPRRGHVPGRHRPDSRRCCQA